MASSTPLAFRSWDTTSISTSRPPLKDILARVAAERGHFRDITESALIAEISAPSSPSATSLSPSSDDDDDVDDESSQQPNSLHDLHMAKNDMLAALASAQQETALALDSISLLCTAQVPSAATTVSPMLKSQGIPMGSLGVDFWNPAPVDRVRVDEEIRLSKAVRISQLRESAESLFAAAERLQGNVQREKVFWEEMVRITESGWSVSRIPNTQGLLGVHFGFNGAVREFAERDLAALVAGQDGKVVLARGVGTKPKGLRVVVKREGRIVGSSSLPAVFDSEETALEERIRAARDSLYDEELQHEMVRESRGLLSWGVSIKGNTFSFLAGENQTVELELLSLDQDHVLPDDALHTSDHLAQAILLAARLLLSHSHRETLLQKSLPPAPMSEKKDSEKPILLLLRPILSIVSYYNDITDLNSYLENLETVLGTADIDTSLQPATFSLPLPTSSSSQGDERISLDAATLTTTLLRPLRSTATLSIPGDSSSSFTLDFSILADPKMETTYTLSLPTITATTTTTTTTPQTFHLPTLQDLFIAADEFLAGELVERLHSAAPVEGAAFELDRREGSLVREGERFFCAMHGEEGRMVLKREGGDFGEREVVWGKGIGEGRSLWEEWGRMMMVDGER